MNIYCSIIRVLHTLLLNSKHHKHQRSVNRPVMTGANFVVLRSWRHWGKQVTANRVGKGRNTARIVPEPDKNEG